MEKAITQPGHKYFQNLIQPQIFLTEQKISGSNGDLDY